jgi:hypothetical protein
MLIGCSLVQVVRFERHIDLAWDFWLAVERGTWHEVLLVSVK